MQNVLGTLYALTAHSTHRRPHARCSTGYGSVQCGRWGEVVRSSPGARLQRGSAFCVAVLLREALLDDVAGHRHQGVLAPDPPPYHLRLQLVQLGAGIAGRGGGPQGEQNGWGPPPDTNRHSVP